MGSSPSPSDLPVCCALHRAVILQPDVFILCDRSKRRKWGVKGAPDFILEILSPSTRRKDCLLKLHKYENAGVREYWILDPYQEKLLIYWFEQDDIPQIRGLDEPVPVGIYGGDLIIDLKHILRWIRE